MLDGFVYFDIDTGGQTIRGCWAGSGPPVLLLHGFPQTHVMWREVAAQLARDFTVVATDLRGYGGSSKPESPPEGTAYSKRQMALDQVGVMSELGFDRFSVAGHDRGGRCAYRMALDHQHRVDRIAILDVVPTVEVLERTDDDVALNLWRWFFMAQPAPLPERLIAADPDGFYFGGAARLFDPCALAEYRAAVADPAAVHAMCEDYRAMVAVDVEHDREDRRRGRLITSPLLVLWGGTSNVNRWHDVLDVWRRWAPDVRGRSLGCGHFLPEEAPTDTAHELASFFAGVET